MSISLSPGHQAESSFIATPDLAALGHSLNDIAQALMALQSHEQGLAASPSPHGDQAAAQQIQAGTEGEIRSYYFSPHTLRHEQELLKQYRAESMQDLLAEAQSLLAGVVRLMQSVNREARMRGTVINSLGQLLEQVSALLMRIRNVHAQVQRVEQ